MGRKYLYIIERKNFKNAARKIMGADYLKTIEKWYSVSISYRVNF